ncbi:MAG: UbiX family flavin prenyltransferase [Clostridiales bacterium]|nr:UbiX family flavin prenyltransferase [Clostridiales bacterium]
MDIIVGVTGATCVEMSYYLVKALKAAGVRVHLIVSDGAKLTWQLESNLPFEDLISEADVVYDIKNMAAAVSSGTFVTDGMVVLPCSMKTLAGVASGYADNLINRAVDVCLKEGRKVVLVPREAPLSKLHLRNMLEASESGCVILPPVLSFYQGEITIEGQINHIIGKILMQFGLKYDKFNPWKGM